MAHYHLSKMTNINILLNNSLSPYIAEFSIKKCEKGFPLAFECMNAHSVLAGTSVLLFACGKDGF